MINWEQVKAFQEMAGLIAASYPYGVVFGVVKGNTIIWKYSTPTFDPPVFQVGAEVSSDGGAARSMREKRQVTVNIPRGVYGPRMQIVSMPIVDGGEANGALSICTPRVNPLARAFDFFAPRITEMLPEGGVLYITDTDKVAYKQGSDCFDMEILNPGTLLHEKAVAREAMRSRQTISKELDGRLYGVPVLVSSSPLFDEDNPMEVVGSFGMCIPKANSVKTRRIAEGLNGSLGDISSVLQQLASSSMEINNNEKELNDDVREVLRLSEEINGVLGFIKQIADQTKMLGLNAAIEAARAGETGRGFGVVAEEIRKLSDESRNTVGTIRELTDNIKSKVASTEEMSRVTLKASEEQAASTQEITASVEELNRMADELLHMARNM